MSVKLMMSFDDSLCQYGEHLTGLRLREPNAAIVLARVTAEGSFRANRGLNRGSDRIAETVYVGLALLRPSRAPAARFPSSGRRCARNRRVFFALRLLPFQLPTGIRAAAWSARARSRFFAEKPSDREAGRPNLPRWKPAKPFSQQ